MTSHGKNAVHKFGQIMTPLITDVKPLSSLYLIVKFAGGRCLSQAHLAEPWQNGIAGALPDADVSVWLSATREIRPLCRQCAAVQQC